MAEAYRKSPGEDFSVLMALRMTPQMDHAVDSYLDKAGKAMYQSKAAFVRDAIFKALAGAANTNTASTVVGGLRLLVQAANDELLAQDVANAVTQTENSIEFYIRNNAPSKIAESLTKAQDIISNIDDQFWKSYLQQQMDQSQKIQQAKALALAAGYIV